MKVEANIIIKQFPHYGKMLIDVPDDATDEQIKKLLASIILDIKYTKRHRPTNEEMVVLMKKNEEF